MRRFHIAIGVNDIAASIQDYNQRLGQPATTVVANEFALWQTDTLNFSIRKTNGELGVRHIGWEDSAAVSFSESKDVNGIIWEHFSAAQQRSEIETLWPQVKTNC